MGQIIKCPRCAKVVDDGLEHMAAKHDEKLGRDEWTAAIVAAAPPLTPAQRDTIARLMRPTQQQVHVDASAASDALSEMME